LKNKKWVNRRRRTSWRIWDGKNVNRTFSKQAKHQNNCETNMEALIVEKIVIIYKKRQLKHALHDNVYLWWFKNWAKNIHCYFIFVQNNFAQLFSPHLKLINISIFILLRLIVFNNVANNYSCTNLFIKFIKVCFKCFLFLYCFSLLPK
jgi:hypothetical protein